tara:strand:+ start:155 stop:472 length:318 start_codon:yes stop_codon:yes gene_type:complete
MGEKRVYEVHTDPGHGWAKVSLEELRDLNADLQKISGYSYIGKHEGETFIYLEEDQDILVLIKALGINDIEFEFKEIYADPGFVRYLPQLGSMYDWRRGGFWEAR